MQRERSVVRSGLTVAKLTVHLHIVMNDCYLPHADALGRFLNRTGQFGGGMFKQERQGLS